MKLLKTFFGFISRSKKKPKKLPVEEVRGGSFSKMLEEMRENEQRERDEIASRMLARGYDPTIAYELTQEGVSELKRRLNEQESIEENFFSRDNFIAMLLSKLGQRKKKQLPLLRNDLPKDPARVKELKIESLKKECKKLAGELGLIENQIELTRNRENSEDQLANLENIKAPIEEELKQKLEEINCLTDNSTFCSVGGKNEHF